MLAIQPAAPLKKTTVAFALSLLCIVTSACSNKVEKAYKRAQEAQQELDRGDIPAARQSIADAIQAKDDLIALHLLKGKIELAGNAPAAAYAAYANAAALDPANVEAQHGVALTALQSNHLPEAGAAAATLLATNPHDPVAAFTNGVLALRREAYGEAVAAADRVLARDAANGPARVLKVRALYLSGDRAAAMAELQKADAAGGQSRELALIALEVARANRQAPMMLQAFATLRRLKASTPQLALDEANTLYKSGNRAGGDSMVLAQLAAPKTTPDMVRQLVGLWREYGPPGPVTLPATSSPAAREEVARYLAETNRAKEAMAILALAPSPNSDGIKALALLNQGLEPAAGELAQRVVAADPGQCEARQTLARISLRARRYDDAVLQGSQALGECPGLADAAQTLALAYGALKQDSQIERVYRDTIAKAPDSLRLYTAYVAYLRDRKQADRAETAAQRLTRIAPSRASSWRLLASACTGEPCTGEAKAGLAAAATAYRIDRRPGEMPRFDLYAPLPVADRP